MQNIKFFLRKSWPFILFIFLYLVVFYKVFFQNLYPFPGDLLVSWFFPYKDGGWIGFSPWITQKEFIAADVIRQLYPWRHLAMDIFKSGGIPLWNPYSFAGTPLLANVQSAVFYPLNILFFFFTSKSAWLIYILIQPILAFIFMYIFIRSLGLTKLSAVFTGFAFGLTGYILVWFELGVVGHTALWLPLILWSITKRVRQKNTSYLLIGSFGIAFSILAGHAQTASYVLIITTLFYIVNYFKEFTFKIFLKDLWFIFLGVGMSAIQIVPSIEFMSYSARTASNSLDTFHKFKIPFENLVTLFVPDFFGNPASGNFLGKDYGEFTLYSGIVALIFAAIGIYHNFQNKIVKLFSFLGLAALIFAISLPVSDILPFLNIPILGTSLPARSVFIFMTSLVILAGYGINSFLKSEKISLKPLISIAVVYFSIGLIILIYANFPNSRVNILIAKRNFILPLIIFSVTSGLIIFAASKKQLHFLVLIICLFISAFEYQYFFNKYSPLSEGVYVFPEHPLVNFLSSTSTPDRVIGRSNAGFATNIPVEWRINSPDGYDPLFIKRYGELIYYAKNNSYSQTIPRSDVVLPEFVSVNTAYSQSVITNLLGVKYIVDKNDNEYIGIAKDDGFPKDKYELIWQKSKWRVYKSKTSLPRAIVFYDGEIVKGEKDILKKLFSKNFEYRKRIILEEDPSNLSFTSKEPTKALITHYTPNQVEIKVNAKNRGMLFLSDSFFPGWIAYVNGKKSKIYRADYAFRGVVVEKGQNTVTFIYSPLSFSIGAIISMISLLFASIVFIKRKK